MKGSDDTHVAAAAVARCEGCGLAYDVDVLGADLGESLGECDDCGSPVYLVEGDLTGGS